MKTKNIPVIILVTLILLMTVVYVFFSLRQEKVLPPQETQDIQEADLSPNIVREQMYGTIKDMRVEADGVYLSLLTNLPVSTDSLTPEEYASYTPETFPREEKEWKFFIPLTDEAGSAYFSEGKEISVQFEGSPSQESYVEVLFFM